MCRPKISYTYLLTYLLTPWCRIILEKLTALQLVKKFPAFHGTRRFITALTSGQPNPVHITTSHLLEIHPNIIHPSTPRSPHWFLPSGFPTKTLYTPSPHPYAPHAQPISFFSILSPAQYWMRIYIYIYMYLYTHTHTYTYIVAFMIRFILYSKFRLTMSVCT